MSLKDRFDRFIDYFTEDEDLSLPNEKRDEPILTPSKFYTGQGSFNKSNTTHK